MTRTFRTTLFVTGALAILLAAGAVGARTAADALAADLEADWLAQKDRIVALADAMPGEKYEFKATAPQRTYGEQFHHLQAGADRTR